MRSPVGIVISTLVTALVFSGPSVSAQTFNSGSTGADGVLTPTANVTLTLPANGVFNFTTVNIPFGVTVRFARNAANTPVTMLATGNVTIAGTIDVSGAAGGDFGGPVNPIDDNGGAGGPGGFDGGSGGKPLLGRIGGAGLGPGGGRGATGSFNASGGGFGTAGQLGCGPTPQAGAVYGTTALLPPIGGSGGGGGVSGTTRRAAGGGGGGGAILVAASGTLTVNGTIVAVGGRGGSSLDGGAGGGGGSGGAVRLVATTITGNARVDVSSGRADSCVGIGGFGRIRVEAFNSLVTVSGVDNGLPDVVTVQLPNPAVLATTPALAITSVAGNPVSGTPSGSFGTPDVTLPAGTTNPISVGLSASNIPPGTTVTVNAVGIDTAASSVTVTLAGNLAASTATANVTIPTDQASVIFAFATFTATAAAGSGPVFVEGEEVERVTVSAGLGVTSRVAYVTKSGREIVVNEAQ